MATNFPTSLDSLVNPNPTQTLDSPSHSTQHANLNDAVEALEAKVGVNSSAVATSHDKILTLKANIASPSFTGPVVSAGTVTAPTFIGALTGNANSATTATTATTVTTNANLTGPVTSVGNATTISAGAVDTTQLAAGAVTNSKIVDDAVQNSKIKDGAVTGPKIYKKIQNFSGPTYTVTATDWILSHTTASDVVVTLPNAATHEGRSLQFRNTVPYEITSATDIVVALTSAATPNGTQVILSAIDGGWCELVSNGTYWLIVNASEPT
jgi:hypothetical protein